MRVISSDENRSPFEITLKIASPMGYMGEGQVSYSCSDAVPLNLAGLFVEPSRSSNC